MPRVRIHKNSFAGGEVSPWILGRRDLRAYENGASLLRNVFVHPAGGVSRRPGLRYVDTVRGSGRLIAFEFNTEQVYLLIFTHNLLSIYREGLRVAEISTPWTEQHLQQMNWTQSADTLLVVHPAVSPKSITRRQNEQWAISDWAFYSNGTRILTPHHKFAGSSVTVQPSGTSGNVTVTASTEVFVPAHVGVRLRIAGKEAQITQYLSASVVRADLKEPLANTAATADWTEQTFSTVRGWPVSVCFHQDRLVIGGSRDLPDYLWLSRSGDLFDFDLGEGLDDEAIAFPILSDQVNAIRHVFSGRHLQVFTSGAEWMVTGEPLTPTNIQVRRQTRIGSRVDRTVPPQDVDGATLFVPRAGPQLREFLFTDTEQAYQATDLALLAHHLVRQPVDMDFDKSARLLHIVMSDGSLATMTVYRDEQVSAWTRQETDGSFRGVAVVGAETYVLVERAGGLFVEKFDVCLFVDSGLDGASPTPRSTWSGLTHLDGQSVKVLADGVVRSEVRVASGAIALDEPVRRLQAGLGFRHVIEPLPAAAAELPSTQGGKMRPVALSFRLWDTSAFYVDCGKGIRAVPLSRFGGDVLDVESIRFSGDRHIRTLGWHQDTSKPLWRIEQDVPLPFTLLSVSAEISING